MEHGSRIGLPGILGLSFRLILGGMFVYAGIMKMIEPAEFAQAIANYRILPAGMIHAAAIVLPWVELLAGTSLMLGLLLPGGSFLIAGLLLVFACALGFDLWRGLDISCGCFGAGEAGGAITWLYVLRDTLLFCMACFVWSFSLKSPLALDNMAPGRNRPGMQKDV